MLLYRAEHTAGSWWFYWQRWRQSPLGLLLVLAQCQNDLPTHPTFHRHWRRQRYHHHHTEPPGQTQRAVARGDFGADGRAANDREKRCAGGDFGGEWAGFQCGTQFWRYGWGEFGRGAAFVQGLRGDDGCDSGDAAAGDCQLVATCELAIAADTASFAIPGGKAGLFCHTPLVAVARNLGRKRALEMALTGDAISAATAADWGLINRAVPADQLDAAVLDMITRATRGSAMAKGAGKRGFYSQIDTPQTTAYELAAELMATGALTSDGQENFKAFLEKRSAVYTQKYEF
jgi:Enoyl-CoA hydratase/isomerase